MLMHDMSMAMSMKDGAAFAAFSFFFFLNFVEPSLGYY
jgi:hypothetical protein